MEEKDVKEVFTKVQELLDTLQDEEATFLFIGHEGNHFVLSGDPVNIEAQLMFSMLRYPIIKKIVCKCAEKFDEIQKECGESVKSVEMQHLIEKNSGN